MKNTTDEKNSKQRKWQNNASTQFISQLISIRRQKNLLNKDIKYKLYQKGITCRLQRYINYSICHPVAMATIQNDTE